MYKKYYTEALKHYQNKLHLCAHSHHLWPDVTKLAHLKYWEDSIRLTDDKWEHIFGEVIPKAQKHIAKIINWKESKNIAFAPNTHEFIIRLLSCLDFNKKIKILTTDGEFHSFRRQAKRLEEDQLIELDVIPAEPFATLDQRIIDKIKKENYSMVFVSHVFFNSGVVLENIEEIVSHLNDDTIFVLDGYHGFAAVPTDLSRVSHRIFYLSGGYKYAQAGEGACFMAIPSYKTFRPRSTGWFASFDSLGGVQTKTSYANFGQAFMGATFDPTGLYRLNAVFDWWQDIKLEVKDVHAYVQKLEQTFLQKEWHKQISKKNLIFNRLENHGHFLTYKLDSPEVTKALHLELKEKGIITDYRADRLRFGFGLYQSTEDFSLL